jgi:hypothetical protein
MVLPVGLRFQIIYIIVETRMSNVEICCGCRVCRRFLMSGFPKFAGKRAENLIPPGHARISKGHTGSQDCVSSVLSNRPQSIAIAIATVTDY